MRTIFFLLLINANICFSQTIKTDISKGWQFRQEGSAKWYNATVPGTVHTDLLNNKLIPDPFFGENEKKLQWIDKVNWEYRKTFEISEQIFARYRVKLIFDGLDTYADVYLNGSLVLRADNMFRGWEVDANPWLRSGTNILSIKFYSAQNKVDSIAKARLPLVLPDNNRVYARKAQFQFGWDWGPKLVGCGIWKSIRLETWQGIQIRPSFTSQKTGVKLIQKKDSIGASFYFEKNGKPVFIKGANWIPADIFLPRVTKSDYRKLLQMAKDANINMLRVWGGGVYEDDIFYELCDEMGIMVWQDLMFAGGMYPGDADFIRNVKEEVLYQLDRLSKYTCIVLWCGNNEIDEAWHNWGWQQQFNLHGTDSAKVWEDYTKLFEDSIPAWIHNFDPALSYIPTSPKFGWGKERSYTEGDSHYWGLWWGLEDWETFHTKTGRFVSEYGMQALPGMHTINEFTLPADRKMNSEVIRWHQKANDGFKKLDHYLVRYFIDSTKLRLLNLKEYSYLSQCLQYYILKNSIIVHKSKEPFTMGTVLWQLNDCWPVTSWSIIDYNKRPKAGWYAVRHAYQDDAVLKTDTVYPKDLVLPRPQFRLTQISSSTFAIECDKPAKYIYLYSDKQELVFSDNYFNLAPGEKKLFSLNNKQGKIAKENIKIMSLYDVIGIINN